MNSLLRAHRIPVGFMDRTSGAAVVFKIEGETFTLQYWEIIVIAASVLTLGLITLQY